jgi:hypothetical protein
MAPSLDQIVLQTTAIAPSADNRRMNVSGSGCRNGMDSFAPVREMLTTVQLTTGDPSRKSIQPGQLSSIRGAREPFVVVDGLEFEVM